MPDTTPGEAVPAHQPKNYKPIDAARIWYIWKYLHAATAEDPKSSFIAGYERAYRDSLMDQTDFSGLVPLLHRLLVLLEDLSIERDVIRTVASGEVEI